jgi:adenylylsulfate kinase-like enzyme
MSWQKNQKQRDRQARQRDNIRNELNYYQSHSFSTEDQEFVQRRIAQLQRELDHNGVPNTYR